VIPIIFVLILAAPAFAQKSNVSFPEANPLTKKTEPFPEADGNSLYLEDVALQKLRQELFGLRFEESARNPTTQDKSFSKSVSPEYVNGAGEEWRLPTRPRQLIPETPSQQTLSSDPEQSRGFQWFSAIKETLFFTTIQHSVRIAGGPKTRRELQGPFFKDYFRSVRNLRGWDDGNSFFTNYYLHPLQGGIYGFIQIQNDPKGIKQEFGNTRAYWISRLKAFGWSALWSTQFEIGPYSEASLGNSGLRRRVNGKSPLAIMDLVTTPTLGTLVIIGEDIVDRYVLRKYEERWKNSAVKAFFRILLNPSRTFANIVRLKDPWHRDTRARPGLQGVSNSSDAGNTASSSRDGKQETPYLLKRGTNEFTMSLGGSFDSLDLHPPDRKFFILGLRYGRVIASTSLFTLAYNIDVTPLELVFQPRTEPDGTVNTSPVLGAGISPTGFKVDFGRRSRIKPFLNINGGIIYFNRVVPVPDARQFNFTFDAGGGVQIFTNPRRAISFGYKFHHFSNRDTAPANPGLDSNIFYMGFSIFK